MSTLSSSLNASAGALVKDWGGVFRTATPTGTVAAARWATVLFAALQSLVAIAAYNLALDNSVIVGVLAIAAFSTGLLLGLFLLGLLRDRSSEAAGLIGLACGAAACSWVAFGTDISWPWYSLVGSLTTASVGYLAALILPPSRGVE